MGLQKQTIVHNPHLHQKTNGNHSWVCQEMKQESQQEWHQGARTIKGANGFKKPKKPKGKRFKPVPLPMRTRKYFNTLMKTKIKNGCIEEEKRTRGVMDSK